MGERTCSIDGCNNGGKLRRGWCEVHYARWKRNGTFDRLPPRYYPRKNPPLSLEERFWAKVDRGQPDACWRWTASTGRGGYGQFVVNGSSIEAHRFSYELSIGPIPGGMQIDHVCHTRDLECKGGECPHRLCVNPSHLEPVTRRENLLRGRGLAGVNSRKTACPAGHVYDEANTRFEIHADGGVGRKCRACCAARERRRRARKRELS